MTAIIASKKKLTDRQQNVYNFIRDRIVERGYGPTVREIGEHLHIRSPNGVMCHLRALEKKGFIKRLANKSRAIELVEPARPRGIPGIPLAGKVSAGTCLMAFELEDRVDFGSLLHREDRFALVVNGDSMIDAQIADGDFVVVQKQSYAFPGQIVVAKVNNDETTLKYWFPESGRIRLQPANSRMEPIIVDHAEVQGVVVGVVRRLR